jgi:hypothetical protein
LDIVEIHTVVLLCLFKGWLRVYYGLDLLLSKLSKAQRHGKFRERHSKGQLELRKEHKARGKLTQEHKAR